MNKASATSKRMSGLVLLAVTFMVANFTHFAHNAEYLPFYPGMPAWLSRDHVYLVWLAGVSLLLGAYFLRKLQFHKCSLVLLAAYGATGLDGLLHYTLALCSEHTLATNITIWAEVSLGLFLLLASAVALSRLVVPAWQPKNAA